MYLNNNFYRLLAILLIFFVIDFRRFSAQRASISSAANIISASAQSNRFSSGLWPHILLQLLVIIEMITIACWFPLR